MLNNLFHRLQSFFNQLFKMRFQNESGEETDDSDSYKYPHSMVSRMTGGTVRPGPGYNTGTLKSSLSGFSAHNSQTETDDQNILR